MILAVSRLLGRSKTIDLLVLIIIVGRFGPDEILLVNNFMTAEELFFSALVTQVNCLMILR